MIPTTDQDPGISDDSGRDDSPNEGAAGSGLMGLLVGLTIAVFVGFALLAALVGAVGLATSPINVHFEAGVGGVVAGFVAGMWGLLSIWAVFGTRRWFVRWPLTLAATALLPFLFLGWATLFLPVLCLAVQAPLWILRFLLNYHFVVRGLPAEAASLDSRIGVEHLLGAMTIVAIAMGLARTGLALNPKADGGPIPLAAWSHLLLPCGLLVLGSATYHASLLVGGPHCQE